MSFLGDAIEMGFGNSKDEAVSSQQLELAADAQRIATAGSIFRLRQAAAQVFVAEAVEQETSLAEYLEEPTVLGADWLQSPVSATLLLNWLTDRIENAVRRFRFSSYGERLQIALISGPSNLHQPGGIGHAFAQA